MGFMQGPYKAVGQALEVIPRTLAQNCGTNVIRALTKLRAKHSEKGGSTFGIDGNKGVSRAIRYICPWSSLSNCYQEKLTAERCRSQRRQQSRHSVSMQEQGGRRKEQ